MGKGIAFALFVLVVVIGLMLLAWFAIASSRRQWARLLTLVSQSGGMHKDFIIQNGVGIFGTYTLSKQAVESMITKELLRPGGAGSSTYHVTEKGHAFLEAYPPKK